MADTTITISGTPGAAYVGEAYSFTPTATGGTTASYAWSATGLPAGLSISATTGAISGTPTATGTASVKISLTDGTNTGTDTVSIVVNAGLALTGTPTAGYIGVAYTWTPSASGGVTTGYSYSATGLPAGLSISKTTGAITGTPTAAGTADAVITLTDGVATKTLDASIGINPAVTLTGTPAEAVVNTKYQFSPTVANEIDGGVLNVTLTTGTLPAGLSLNPATGTVSGTPTATGSSAVTFTVTDGNTTSTVDFTFSVATRFAIVPSITQAVLDKAYSFTFTTSGGASTSATWEVSEGTLPEGLTLASATGVLSGLPLVQGVYPFTLVALGNEDEISEQAFLLEVVDQQIAEGEGKTAAQIRFETVMETYISTLSGVDNPTDGQLQNASAAILEASEILLRTCTDGILDSALATVTANTAMFSPANLDRGLSYLTATQARMIHTLWGQFYITVSTPTIPVGVTSIIRDCRRMKVSQFMRDQRFAA